MSSKQSYSQTESAINSICQEMANFLIAKNRKYGDNALNPIQIFCKADAEIQLLARIDDKINRANRDNFNEDEDIVWDLMGYLVQTKVQLGMNEPRTDHSKKAEGRDSSTIDEIQVEYSLTSGEGRWRQRTDTSTYRED